MLFTDLPDHCLLLIFDFCEMKVLAKLSTVCTKLSEFIRTNIFLKRTSYRLTPMNKYEIIDELKTVARLVTSVNPTHFHVKLYRNLATSKEMPIISLDLYSSATEVFVETHFLKYLDLWKRRIESIHIHCSIYDCHNNDGVDMGSLTSWSELKKLAVSGYNQNIMHMIDFPQSAWNFEIISFHDMLITSDFIRDALQTPKMLKNIVFEKCKFDVFEPGDYIQIATAVQDRRGHFPLALTFISVIMEDDAILEDLQNEVVGNYLSIQFGNHLPSMV